MEIWKEIKGYEDYYVSNYGNVTSLKNNNIRLLKKENIKGYLRVSLCKNNIVKRFLIHRLVALAFIPNPENKPQVNHINAIKSDNRVENLEWATAKENRYHSHINNLQNYVRGENCSYAKLTEKEVIEILKIGKSITKIEISKKYKISRRHITDILNRKRWSHIKF